MMLGWRAGGGTPAMTPKITRRLRLRLASLARLERQGRPTQRNIRHQRAHQECLGCRMLRRCPRTPFGSQVSKMVALTSRGAHKWNAVNASTHSLRQLHHVAN